MKVKILIPAMNEENNIRDVVKSFAKIGEVIICDNKSQDNTTEKAEEAGAKVVFEKRKGKGYCIRRLLEENADIYVLVDGDDAFYAQDCKRMINLIKQGRADMVIGRRTNLNEHNKNSIFLRKVFLRLLAALFRARFGKIHDFMSGFRAFNGKVKGSLNLTSKGFGIDAEITIRALKNRFKILEIPVRVKPRKYGRQKSNVFNVGMPVLKRIILS